METAMCLIECNQPVYPLDIVRTMRDQRAMMIQTPVSNICCSTLQKNNFQLSSHIIRWIFNILAVDHIAKRSPVPSVAVALASGRNKLLRLLERSNYLNFYKENLKKQQLFQGYLAINVKKGLFSVGYKLLSGESRSLIPRVNNGSSIKGKYRQIKNM